MAVQRGKGGITSRSIRDGAIIPGKVLEDVFAGKHFKQLFPSALPHSVAADGYGDPTGATGNANLVRFFGGFGQMDALTHVKGAGQTLLAPTNDATNGYLLAGLDIVAAEGIEYVLGGMRTINNPFAVKCGDVDYPAMFVRLRMVVPTVANAAECAVGFVKAETAQANLDDYDELFCLNLQAGTLNRESILNGAGTVTVDTGQTVADGIEFTLEVQVRARRAEGFLNGMPVSAGALFSFDADEIVVPFLFFLQGGAGTAWGWYELEVGQLQHVGRDASRR